MTYTVGSLFSGIGGLDLGFERAGFEVAWFCEADGFCRNVLAKHWPGVPCYEDVRAIHGLADGESKCGYAGGNLPGDRQRGRSVPESRDGGGKIVERTDILIGGFPCQDVSHAGKRAGLDGARSGLWKEFARLVGELRPRCVAIGGIRATGRISDLRAQGHIIHADHVRGGIWRYTYRGGPR